jgi:hypothetical protein
VRLSPQNTENIVEPAMLRTSDGVLHVVWVRKDGGNDYDYRHTPISKSGRVGPSDAIGPVTNWVLLQNPDLVPDATSAFVPVDRMRLVFTGQRTIDTTDFFSSGRVFTATAGKGGKSWLLDTTQVMSQGTDAQGSVVGAGLHYYGSPVVAWASGIGALHTHWGAQAAPDADQTWAPSHYAYDPDVALDRGIAEMVLGWYSNQSGRAGLYAMRASFYGGPGTPLYAPGSANAGRTAAVQPIGRTQISGRTAGGGVYIAYCGGYPTCKTVRFWKVGASTARVLATAQAANVAVAAGPKGRMWVLWTRDNRVYGRRSNPGVTRFGRTVSVPGPSGSYTSIYQLDAEATRGPADVVVNAATGVTREALWYRRLFPGLTLTATPRRFDNAKRHRVVFRVTDAGAPVSGATVRVAGRVLRTGAKGRVATTFRKGFHTGRYEARAGKAGYSPDAVTIRVT